MERKRTDEGGPVSRDPDWEVVEEIVGHAERLAPEEREAFLDEACGGDAELRAEVESLLERLETSASFFDRLEERAREMRAEVESAPPAERIGPYEIIEEIGRGGMGVVWKARDTRLDRIVALKFLPVWTSGDPEAVERLVGEARAASSIDHPNIATVHDVAEAADGKVALVFAYYEGETLADRLARETLDVAEAADIGRQVAAGLQAAHRYGIVHRDIKPSNLMVTRDGRVKILDFGIARTLEVERTRSRARGGGGAGTAAYMAPEQVRGEAVDARADLWGLGVVLYEAVTGKRPFSGRLEVAILRSVLDDDPDPVMEAGPLAAVIDRLLAKDPADRYPDAVAVRRDLERVANGQPVTGAIGGDHGVDRGRFSSGRLRRVAVVGAILAVAGAAFFGAWRARPGAEPPPMAASGAEVERVAILPFEVRGSPDLAYLGEGMVDLLSTSMDGAGAMQPVDPNAVFGRVPGDGRVDLEDAGRIAGELGARQFVLGDVVEVEGRLRVRAGLYQRGRPDPIARASVEGTTDRLFNLVDELTAQLLLADVEGPGGRFARVAAVTTSSLPALKAYLEGEGAMRQGRFSEAVEAFRRAVRADTMFALAHYRLSKSASWDRRHGLARESAERAVRYSDRLAPTARQVVEASWANWLGDRDEAERLYRRTLATAPDHVEAWHELGELLFHYNQIRGRSRLEAKSAFQRVLALDPTQAEPLYHLIELAVWEEDSVAAGSLFRRLDEQAAASFEWRALRAFFLGGPRERAAIVDDARGLEEREIYRAVESVVTVAPTDPEAERLTRLLTERGRTPDWRAVGHWGLAHLALARGRWDEAAGELRAARSLDPAWGREHLALYASLPFHDVPRGELEAIHADLEAWDAGATPPSVSRLAAVHDGLHGPIRLYLLGLLEDRLDRSASALRRARALEATTLAPLPWLPGALAATVRSRVAASDGRHQEALALLEGRESRVRADQTRSPILSEFYERWLRAELLRELGRGEEAVAWYHTTGDHSMYGLPYRAMSWLRRAEVAEAAGDDAAAGEARRRYRALWSGPDRTRQIASRSPRP